VLIAITATAIGFAFDAGSGSKQLSTVFAVCYVLGCVGAVLAVRQAALFTAVVQPPLVLFASVPTAYLLFTGSQIDGIKDLAINCGYPLIERFPLMFFTSAGVLLIGLVRWYIGMTVHRAAPVDDDAAEAVAAGPGLLAGVTAKISSLFGPADTDEPAAPPRRRRPAPERTRTRERAQRPERRERTRTERAERAERAERTRAGERTRTGRPAARTTPPRSRHARPPETEIADPTFERPRRPRPARQGEPPAEPRRRPRPPRQPGPPPTERRTGYERTGYDRYERPGYERTGYERPERSRRRYDDYEPREPHTRNGSHHPVSRVRYRGEENDDRAQYRPRRRTPEGRDVDSWQYDI
jgi:hypothetical protein